MGTDATMSRTATVVGAVLLVCSSVPIALGYLIAPADRQFMGIVSDVPDWAQYLAWMHGFATRVVIENPLTCETQSPAFFNLQWFILGRLATWLPLPVVLETFRLATGAAFLVLTWRITRAYFRDDRRATWTAWWLINVSAGWGLVWVADKYLFGRTDARNPLDIYIAEPITLQNMTIFPHFLVAAALILIIFRCAAAAIDEQRWQPAFLSGAAGLVLGLTHAYDLVIIYSVLGVFFVALLVQHGWSWFRLGALAVIGILSFPPPAYFAYLTSTDPVWRKVLGQFGDAGVFTPTPPHLLILVGLPLVLTLLTITNVFAWRQPTAWRLLVRVWCVVNFFLLYVPADFQVHMLSGWQIPLGLLATEGLYAQLWPRVRDRLARTQASRRSVERLGAVALVALTLPTNIYLLAWRVREVARVDHNHYLHRDEIDVVRWVNTQARNGETVLASITVGQFIPSMSSLRPYVAHWAQTVEFRERRARVAAFFSDTTTDAQRIETLRQCDTRYLIFGRAERELGPYDPAVASFLTPVVTVGSTAAYRVNLPPDL